MKRLGILQATGALAGANAAALALTFFTTILIAREFGSNAQMDAYALAVSIPESLQYVLMLATLSVVFTPLFIDTRTRHGENDAWSMALSLLVLVVGGAILVIPLLALVMPWLMYVLAPGFAAETRALAVELSDLILPGLIYYATAGLLLGICYAYHDFTTAAVNTVLLAILNLVAFLVFVQLLQLGVRGLMLGRLCALVVLQIFLVWRVLRLRGALKPRIHLTNPHLWKMMTYLPPYMFGALSGQLELIVNRSLISTLGAGSVAAWGYGQRLADIPMAVLGAAFGTTYLPDFAANVAAENNTVASAEWNRVVLRIAFVLAPIAAILVTLGAPLIALLFQRGAFDATATENSARVLTGLALALPLRGIGGLIVRALPAFKARGLPLALSALSTGASIILALAWLGTLGLFGVALAASIGDILFTVVGTGVIWRFLQTRDWTRTLGELLKIGLAMLVAGAVMISIAQLSRAEWFGANVVLLLAQISIATVLGLSAFVAATVLLRVQASQTLLHSLVQHARIIARGF
ncbi:MAG TPA: lipid II flippase MurJ [Anaerolineae bacterium]|nr:lipid II flippase MurJ [Anaerolineae bacterium]